MVRGRMEKESNPAGPHAGYAPQHDSTGDEDYVRTSPINPFPINQIGDELQEQLTDADASSGTLTFSENIRVIEIYNRDTADGVFTVNNIDITVPAESSFQAKMGGTPSNTVDVTGSASYIVGRYE